MWWRPAYYKVYPDLFRAPIPSAMTLDDYLHRIKGHRRITLVGPMPVAVPVPMEPPGPAASEAPVIWVDGGANHRRQCADNADNADNAHGEKPGFAVGDGDSFDGKLDQYLDPDKDYSDLAYVLGRLGSRFAEVVLLGFLGARRDHELFNLGEVHHFLAAAKTPTTARFDNCLNAYSSGQWTFEADGIFSLAVLEAATVQLRGACQFPIPTPTRIAPLKSLGLSNRGFGEITLTTRGPAFVFKAPCNDAPK